jgi:ABC-type molybdate transport system substrate-binding protein
MSPNYKIVAELPEGSYPPVKVQAGMLKTSKNKATAQRFLKFLVETENSKVAGGTRHPEFQGEIG